MSRKPEVLTCERQGDGFRILTRALSLADTVSALGLTGVILFGAVPLLHHVHHPSLALRTLAATIYLLLLLAIGTILKREKKIVTIDRSTVTVRFTPLPLPGDRYEGPVVAIALPKTRIPGLKGTVNAYPVFARFSDGQYVRLVDNAGDETTAQAVADQIAKQLTLEVVPGPLAGPIKTLRAFRIIATLYMLSLIAVVVVILTSG